jgi:hypothetical protein
VLSEGADGAPVIDVTGLIFSDLPTGFVQEFRRRFVLDTHVFLHGRGQ